MLNLVAIVGFLWIFSGPWLARNIFTSENALRVTNIDTLFNHDKLTKKAFNRIKNDLDELPKGEKR